MSAALTDARKRFVRLIVAARQSGAISVCGVCRWPPRSLSALDRLAAPVAFDIHLEDGGLMDEPVDGGERHGGVREDLVPLAEGLVGGDQHGAPLVAGADELEQHTGLGLVLGDVCKVVEDEQVELVELGQRALEGEVAPGLLQLLDEIGGAGEHHPVSVLDEGEPDRRGEMALAGTGRTEQEQVCALL